MTDQFDTPEFGAQISPLCADDCQAGGCSWPGSSEGCGGCCGCLGGCFEAWREQQQVPAERQPGEAM